jgi:hypothetical protein
MLLRLALLIFVAVTGLALAWHNGSAQTIPSDQYRSTVGGNPNQGLDSSGLERFDKCRAAVPVNDLNIEEVQRRIEACRAEARANSKTVADPNFSDVKNEISRQRYELQSK